MSAPSTWTPSTVQLFADAPSMSTVHAPHDDVSQPMFVPVSPRRSRRTYARSSRGSTSSVCDVPFTEKVTDVTNDASFVGGPGIETTPRANPGKPPRPQLRSRDGRAADRRAGAALAPRGVPPDATGRQCVYRRLRRLATTGGGHRVAPRRGRGPRRRG